MREGSLETGRIERELDHTRSRLDATIGALQEKLAPGTMVDQAVEYFKEGGGVEIGRNLGRSVRDNPIPVALIGVGLGWLLFSSTRRNEGSSDNGWRDRPWMNEDRFGGGLERDMYGRVGSGRSYMDQSAETSVHQPMPYEAAAYDDLATKAHLAGTRIERGHDESEDLYQDRIHQARGSVLGVTRNEGEASPSFRQRVEEALGAASERVRSLAADAGTAAGHFAERGQSASRSLYDYGQSAVDNVRGRAGSAVDQMRDAGGRTVDYVQEQPLLLGALGIAVGAAIGMLVPSSRYERRVTGSLRESLGETARQIAGEAGQRVSRVAETVLDTAQAASRREGFADVSGSGLASATRERVADVAGRARHVVEETAAAGRDAVKRELSGTAETGAKGTATPNGGTAAADRSVGHVERHAGA